MQCGDIVFLYECFGFVVEIVCFVWFIYFDGEIDFEMVVERIVEGIVGQFYEVFRMMMVQLLLICLLSFCIE